MLSNNHIAHVQVKHSTQLYSTLLVRALSHQDFRMRLAAIIAIGETAIENLSFQMKVIRSKPVHFQYIIDFFVLFLS